MVLNSLATTYLYAFGYDDTEKTDLLIGDLVLPQVFQRNTEYVEPILIADGPAAEIAAKQCVLGHKTVVLRLNYPGRSGWNTKPNDVAHGFAADLTPSARHWYNLSYLGGEVVGRGPTRTKLTPPMTDRAYIHITDPYDEVMINSEEKDGPITVDDVLFASRALACDPFRSADEFGVLSDDGSTILFRVTIDNYSS